MELDRAVDDEMLAAGLGAAAILDRGEAPPSNRSECEIVTCRMPDGSRQRFFCKFGPLAEVAHPADRYGVAYEARVYDQLLSVWPGDVPHLHGAFVDAAKKKVGLALDYLDGNTPLHKLSQPKAGLGAAARWIARFHRYSESAAVPSFLHRYDTGFYQRWMERAARCARRLHEDCRWLTDLCQRCERRLPALLPPATIIHGEYQAVNILVHEGRNVAIDWKSAALAAGEIDLANLAWGWDDDLAGHCQEQYCLARWPDGTPDDFGLRLIAARIFLHLRRLAESESEGGADENAVSMDALLSLAEKL